MTTICDDVSKPSETYPGIFPYMCVTDENYYASKNDCIIGVNARGDCNIFLPPSQSMSPGKVYFITDESGKASDFGITVYANGTDLIVNEHCISITQDYASIPLYNKGDGTWHVLCDY